jgi:signal transduction histidine kinase
VRVCATALLDRHPAPLDGVRDMARIVLRSTEWMHQILSDLGDCTDLNSGRLVLERAPTDVPQLVRITQALFGPVALEEEVELVVRVPPTLPRTSIDSRRIQQVLSNLLGNALKFTPRGGLVVLSADAVDAAASVPSVRAAIRFSVSDSGPGIAAEDLDHVFDWYWRSDKDRVGTGMGLAIARELVEAHGSTLNVESALGEGSTFWFTIPVEP